MRLTLVLLAALPATTLAAFAGGAPLPGPGDDAIVTLGGGARLAPEWDGSKSYVLSPMPIVGFRFLRSPFTGQPTTDTGFGIRPAFRHVGERKFDVHDRLWGLDKVDAAWELGLAADYTDTWFRASVEVRQGFGGHTGQIVDLGLDGIVHPFEHVTLSAGPRLSLASAAYMNTYFGVTAAESARTGLATHRPGGGVRGAGLATAASWEIDPRWVVRADAGWTRLADDAATSPIVRADGARDQFTVGLGVAWRFGVGWH
ncbi:MipA/OmpV family protein [Siculibacillus lacustris]|nr:MipA/OmpV family protein [Siculibacillus lacustris]